MALLQLTEKASAISYKHLNMLNGMSQSSDK